jgi:hypothetical protein
VPSLFTPDYLQVGKLMYVHAHFCGISAPEQTMQYLPSHPTVKAALPIIRQRRYLPCANVIAVGASLPE